jgi:hypothetical protein
MPAQLALKMPPKRPRTDGVFKRKGSPFWYVRIWIGDKVHKFSTGATTRGGALDVIPCMRIRLERERERDGSSPQPCATQPDLI